MTATYKQGLAELIKSMTFGELRTVAADLHAMCEDGDTRGVPISVTDFLELLHDWAEAQ